MSRKRLGSAPGTTDVEQQLAVARPERLSGVQQRRVDGASGVRDDQHHLEERADEDDPPIGGQKRS